MEFQIRYSVKERKGGIFGKKSIEELRRKTALSLGSMKDSDLHDSGLRLVTGGLIRKREFSLVGRGQFQGM